MQRSGHQLWGEMMSQNRLARCLDLLDKVSAVLIDDEDDRLYD